MNLARLLLLRFRWFDDALRICLTEAGFPDLTTTQSMVFPYLHPGGSRPADLARDLGITRQSAHTLVKSLETMGLVELTDDSEDGRSKLIRLSKRGKASVPVALGIFSDLERELSKRIGARRLKELRGAIEADWGDPPF